MGIDVTLVETTREGTSPKRLRRERIASVADQDDFFARTCRASGSPLLARADPYGDLVLTPHDMDQFIAEVGALGEGDGAGAGAGAGERIARIIALALRCREDPGAELHLQGD